MNCAQQHSGRLDPEASEGRQSGRKSGEFTTKPDEEDKGKETFCDNAEVLREIREGSREQEGKHRKQYNRFTLYIELPFIKC